MMVYKVKMRPRKARCESQSMRLFPWLRYYFGHTVSVNVFATYFNAFHALPVCAILGVMTSSILAVDPVVSKISAVQRAGTKLVDITYDVTADTPTIRVSPETSKYGELVEGEAALRDLKSNGFSQKGQVLVMTIIDSNRKNYEW